MKTKARYKFIEFVRPDGYWPLPYSLEQAFGVFAWMLRTGEPYHNDGRWGRQSINSLLSGKPTCVNFSEVEPIRSVADLERRFHYAILSDHVGSGLARWRRDFSVTPSGSRIIEFPYSTSSKFSNAEAEEAIDALLKVQGRLGVQLNEYHSRAREIIGVALHWRGSYRFVLEYGYRGSLWRHTLAVQRPGEPFYATYRRAAGHLARLIDGNEVATSTLANSTRKEP